MFSFCCNELGELKVTLRTVQAQASVHRQEIQYLDQDNNKLQRRCFVTVCIALLCSSQTLCAFHFYLTAVNSAVHYQEESVAASY